jgi:ribosome recycling factor
MIQDVYKKVEETMQKTLNVLQREFASIRTGRASVSLLDGITVDYYGTPTPLNQIATLSAPESNLIVIQPWDPTTIKEIEKAILKSDLGLTPTSDGKVIRLSVPPLTEERRKQLVKVVKKIAEESRVALRQIRKDGNDDLKRMEKNKEIAEDELHKAQEQVQKITDKYMKKIDELLEKKEKEIMEI